jgi:stress response protein SCP2
MTISLEKGQKISLSKDASGNNTGLKNVIVGLGWDAVKRGIFGSHAIDCDASVMLLRGGRFVSDKDLIYYGHKNHDSGAVTHCGDNLTGDGDGDDEQIIIKLDKVPMEYDKIVVVVNIYQAEQRKQDFGLIKNAFMRIVNEDTNQEFARFNLSENYSGMTAMVFGELYRHGDDWKLNPIGQGTVDNSISQLVKRYQ